jgi:hypothetical protein
MSKASLLIFWNNSQISPTYNKTYNDFMLLSLLMQVLTEVVDISILKYDQKEVICYRDVLYYTDIDTNFYFYLNYALRNSSITWLTSSGASCCIQ